MQKKFRCKREKKKFEYQYLTESIKVLTIQMEFQTATTNSHLQIEPFAISYFARIEEISLVFFLFLIEIISDRIINHAITN